MYLVSEGRLWEAVWIRIVFQSFLIAFFRVLKIYIELAGYDRYNGHIETKRRNGL